MILLDTHVMVWLDEANPRLGKGAIERINTAFQAGNLLLSAISFWEVGMLISKGRLRLEMDLSRWRKDFMNQGVIEVPITGEIGITAAGFEQFHGDPADRLIAATALHNSLTLITADRRLLDCKLAIARLDARL